VVEDVVEGLRAVDLPVDEVVELAQDARISDIAIRQASAIQVAFLLMNLLFFNNNLPGNCLVIHIYYIIDKIHIDISKAGLVINPDYSQGSITGGANNNT